MRCAGKGERCDSIGTCVPMDRANGLRLRLSRALQGGQRCGLMQGKAEQRSQRAAARLNRVRSALTQAVRVVMGTNLSVHAASPVEESNQLPFLRSFQRLFCRGPVTHRFSHVSN